jgi:YD repeat-containing protein
MVDGTGTSAYHYDELDRLTEAADGHGDSTGYEYDLANDQTKIIYPNGEAVERTFDNDGRLASVKDWLGNLTSFAYDPDSNLTSTAFPEPTGETDHYAYDLADEMTEANFGKGEETLASPPMAATGPARSPPRQTADCPAKNRPPIPMTRLTA